MKALHITRLLLALLIVAAISSCKNDTPPIDDSLAYIPEDVATVTAINPRKLMNKADFASLSKTDGFQEMIRRAKSTNPVLAKVMMNPEQSGVDLDKNVYIAMEPSREVGRFGVVTLSIADVAAFEALLQDVEIEATPASQNYNLAFPSGTSALAWNDEVAIIGFADEPGSVRTELERYLKTEGKSSAAQNKSLRKSLAKEYDMLNWFSSDFLFSSEFAKNGAAFLNYDEADLKGNYVEHYLTFDEGAIKSKASFDFNGQIAKDLSMLFRDQVKTDFTSIAPAGEPLFLLSTSFDIDGLNQLLIEKYSKGLADNEIRKYGLSSTELLEALHGDIMLSSYPSDREDREADMVFIAKIENEEAIQKLLEVGIKQETLEKTNDGLYHFVNWEYQMIEDSLVKSDNKTYPAHIWLNDGMLYLSNAEALIKKVQQGDTGMKGNLATKGSELLKQHIFTALGNPTAMDEFMEQFGGVESVEASASRKGTELIIEMENKSQNSLKTLIEQLQAAEKEKEASEL
jgi:hypothetical protein